jgi:hypothetical protein
MWLPLLLACSGPDPDDAPTHGTSSSDASEHTSTPTVDTTDTSETTEVTWTTDDPVAGARASLGARGFQVGDGALVFSTMEGCCERYANCWGNNPTTPYGAYAIPSPPGLAPRPDTLLDDFGPVPEGLSRDFLLRPDEAIVWLGTVPPKAKYFGFRSLLGLRPGFDHPVIGSLGAATNQLTLEAQRGEPAWGQPIALVTTADAGVEAEVIDALVAGGWAREHIATDRIAPVVNMGLSASEDDSFFTTMRVAVYEDPAAGAAWEEDPGVVWRLTPESPRGLAPHGMPALPSRGSGTDESEWRGARDALEAAVVAHFEAIGSVQVSHILPYWRETLACIDSGSSCAGDIRDRFVGISPYFVLPAEDDVLVAFGINHERAGKASYSSVSIQTIENQRGIASVTSAEMVGSARPFLDHPLVDDLYVALFARDCSPYAGMVCVEVPWDCPGGPADEVLKITARAYLEPATGAAPIETEMIGDKVLLLYPGADTTDTGTSTR